VWNEAERYKQFDLEGIDITDPARCQAVFNHLRTQDTNFYGLLKFWSRCDTAWQFLGGNVFEEILKMIPPPSSAKARLGQFRAGIEA
jgi:hypothetical protein